MYYWQHARDSLLTPLAIQFFQIAATHDGEEFEAAKMAIDDEWEHLTGRRSQRHGGKFQTYVQVFREAGWIDIVEDKLTVTDVGHQALQLVVQCPDFLKAVPYFLVELLGRYQLNNPAKPDVRNQEVADQIAASDVFPYWTIWKIMRACDNRVSTEELRRFVFQLQRSADVDQCIEQIRQFRQDVDRGLPKSELDTKYSVALEGAVGEPKYLMARAGTQIGRHPPLIRKPSPNIYELEPTYTGLIDSILANEPVFKEDLTPASWMANYSRPVSLEPEFIAPPMESPPEIDIEILDEDPVYQRVSELLGVRWTP